MYAFLVKRTSYDKCMLVQISVPMFDGTHWWLVVVHVKSHCAEIIDTYAYNVEVEMERALQQARDRISYLVVATIGGWLRQAGTNFVLISPERQVSRPPWVVV